MPVMGKNTYSYQGILVRLFFFCKRGNHKGVLLGDEALLSMHEV